MSQIIFIFTPLELTVRGTHVTSALLSGSGLSILAQAMTEPIRRSLQYQDIGRATFNVTPLPDVIYSSNDPFGVQETSRERRDRQRFLPRQNTDDTYETGTYQTDTYQRSAISRANSSDIADANAAAIRSIQAEEDRRIFDTILSITDSTSSDGVDVEMLSTTERVPEGETVFHGGDSIIAGVDKFLTAGFRV